MEPLACCTCWGNMNFMWEPREAAAHALSNLCCQRFHLCKGVHREFLLCC